MGEGSFCNSLDRLLGFEDGCDFSSWTGEKERSEVGVEGAEGVGAVLCVCPRVVLALVVAKEVVEPPACLPWRLPNTANTAAEGLGDTIGGGLPRPEGGGDSGLGSGGGRCACGGGILRARGDVGGLDAVSVCSSLVRSTRGRAFDFRLGAGANIGGGEDGGVAATCS